MKRLKWGILGTASIADSIIAAIRRSEFNEVIAVASRDIDRAREWAGKRGIPKAFGSYDKMLADGGVDIIYNPLPNALHARWTSRAMEAGYPVLCEKPFALNAREAAEVREVSLKTGLIVAEAFMYRFHPVFQHVKTMIRDGLIGDLVTMNSKFSFFEDEKDSIVTSAKLGGGSLMDVGCYCVNLSRMIAGTEPMSVTAMRAGKDVDDTFTGILKFPGMMAEFTSSIACTEQHGAEICGTKACITIPNPWVPGLEDTMVLVRKWGEPDQEIIIPGADTYRMEIEAFARAIITGNQPQWSVDDAIANMKVIDALFESAKTGLHVNLGK